MTGAAGSAVSRNGCPFANNSGRPGIGLMPLGNPEIHGFASDPPAGAPWHMT